MRPGAGARPPGQNPAGPSAYQANSRKPAKPTAPPVPPRTEAQRKKADASFGNSTKRTNFSQPVPDEPPAASNNYSFTARKPANVFAEAAAHAYQQAQQQRPVPPRPDGNTQTQQTRPVPPRPVPDPIDPLSQQFQDTFMDGRQRTPYSAHGGEKFNPFDGATNLNRGKSMRDSPRTGQTPVSSQPPSPGHRHRSASVPDEKDNKNQTSNTSSSRAGSRYTPGAQTQSPGMGAAEASNNAPQGQYQRSKIVEDTSAKKDNQAGAGNDPAAKDGHNPNVYGNFPYHRFHSATFSSTQQLHEMYPTLVSRSHHMDQLGKVYHTSSQAGHVPESFEMMQQRQIQQLLKTKRKLSQFGTQQTDVSQPTAKQNNATDTEPPTSFSFPVDDDTFSPTDQQRSAPKSAESINTRFVADEFAGSEWQFNAGNANEDAFLAAKQRAQARARQARPSPTKKSSGINLQQGTASDPELSSTEQRAGGFNPDQWSSTFGPEAFVPQPPRNHSASPSKVNRPIKKPRSVRMTAGTAGMVDSDESSSSGDRTRPPTATADYANPTPAATDSPIAMDIDTPPAEPSKPATQPSGARNIPVEPSKPEWRAGNVNGVNVDAPPPAPPKAPLHPNRMGSEDTESFFGSASNPLADFRNVAPFAPELGGLGSLGDLASNLPFESKAASKVTLGEDTNDSETSSIPFPACPKAPHPPTALAVQTLKPTIEAWKKYVREFHAYMEQWADFNVRVIGHFEKRKEYIVRSKNETGFNWVESRDDSGIRKWLQWLEDDKLYRQKWQGACETHEMNVRAFLKYKEKMMQ